MPRTRRPSRVDANQAELVKFWRALNGTWQSTHEIAGALDGIAGAWGIDVRVEIKDGNKPPSARRLTQAETETIQNWRGRKPVVWECVEDCERTMKAMYREAMRNGRLYE